MKSMFVMAFLVLGAVALRAEEKALTPEQQLLAGLSQQFTALNVEATSINAKVAELAKDKARLISRGEEATKGFERLTTMGKDLESRASALKADIAQHNVGAGVPAETQAEADEHNRISGVLNAKRVAIAAEVAKYEEIRKGLNEGRDKLKKEVLAWAQSVKDLDGRQETLEKKRKALEKRELSILEDLKNRTALSKDCAAAGNLETAHRCLQKVWDGAK